VTEYEIVLKTRTTPEGNDYTGRETFHDQDLLIKRYNELKAGELAPGSKHQVIESVTVRQTIQYKDRETGDKPFY